MPGPAPAFEHTPVDRAGVRHLHHVTEWDEPRRPPPERRVHRDVQQHPRVVEPLELPAREQERLTPLEQLLRIDPQSERTEHERAMQIDLDAVVRVLVDARLAEPQPRTPDAARAAAAHVPSVPAARTPARSRRWTPTDRDRRTTGGTAPDTSCARRMPPSARRTRCLRRRTRRPGRPACARRRRHHVIASRCAASSAAACSSSSSSQPDATLSTARPVMRSNRIRREQPLPHGVGDGRPARSAGTPSRPNAAIARASVSTASFIASRSVHLLDDPETQEHRRGNLRPVACDLRPAPSGVPRRAGRRARRRSAERRRSSQTAVAPPDSSWICSITRRRHEHVGADAPTAAPRPIAGTGRRPGPSQPHHVRSPARPERVPRVEHELRVLGHPVQVVRAVRREHRDQVGAGDRDGS